MKNKITKVENTQFLERIPNKERTVLNSQFWKEHMNVI